jgi:hypothetical protein
MMDRGLPIVATLALILFAVELAASQERTTDQVAVTVSILRDQVVAVTAGEGLVSVGLTSDDRVLGIEARGLNALVVTSTRLLGFSAQVQRWSEQRLNLNEQVLDRKVTSRLILVRSDRRVFGFQGTSGGLWKVEDLTRLGDDFQQILVGAHVAVLLTNRRALAFSAFTGGFFIKDLSTEDPVIETTVNDNIVILSTANRRLIFRSQLAAWAELR